VNELPQQYNSRQHSVSPPSATLVQTQSRRPSQNHILSADKHRQTDRFHTYHHTPATDSTA